MMVATVGKSRLQAPKLMFHQAMWQDPGPESGLQPFLRGNMGGVKGVRKAGKNYTELLRGNLSNSYTRGKMWGRFQDYTITSLNFK